MESSNDGMRGWRFGEFVLDVKQRRLLHRGELVHVEERPFDLLVLLSANWDRALDRREITAALWGTRPVSDNTLRQLVYKARHAVDDDGEQQHVIRTLHGRSLQWVAPLEPLAEPAHAGPDALQASADAPPRTAAHRRGRHRWWWLAAASVAIAVVATLSIRSALAPALAKPTRLALEPISNRSGDKSLDWTVDGLPGLLAGLLGQAGGIVVIDPLRSTRAWNYALRKGRSRAQQFRYATGADALVGGHIGKLAGKLYELTLSVTEGDRKLANIVLTGAKPGVLAVDAVPRIRAALGLNKPARPAHVPRDPFVAETYSRGMQFASHGNWAKAQTYFKLSAQNAPDFLRARLKLGEAQVHGNQTQAGEATLKNCWRRRASSTTRR